MRGWVTIEKNSLTQGHAMAQAALPVASVATDAEAGIAKPKGLGLRLPASKLVAQALLDQCLQCGAFGISHAPGLLEHGVRDLDGCLHMGAHIFQ